MSEHWTQLESQIDAELNRLDLQWRVDLPRDVLDRTRARLRIALDEAWLDEQMARHPLAVRPGLLSQLKRAAGPSSVSAQPPARPPRSARALSALAAVAMLGICVGIIHLAALHRPAGPAAAEELELFLASDAPGDESDDLTAGLERDLDALEEQIARWWPDQDEPFDASLEELESVLEHLPVESPDDNDTL